MVEASAIRGAKILIVDDQKDNIEILERILQRAGYSSIDSTTNPEAVRELHLKNRYDLILLDLVMPKLDGFQVMDRLKAVETEGFISVLAITGDPKFKLRALQSGARDFIGKPYDRLEILSRIRNMLEMRLLHLTAKKHTRELEALVLERTGALRQSEEMFREFAANIPEALWIRDIENGTIRYVNPSWQKLSGRCAAAGEPFDSILQSIHPEDLEWVTNDRRKGTGGPVNRDYRLVRPDQTIRWVRARSFTIANPEGKPIWHAEIAQDVTAHLEAQRKLVHLAHHDALTNLPNRTLLYALLRDSILEADTDHLSVSVLLLDIDRFKSVNDTFGHAIGDELLREFAKRLSKCARNGDTVARLGGDEFALIVRSTKGPADPEHVANRIKNAMQAPFVFGDQQITASTSIGIACYPADGVEPETLMQYADTAMYEAKAAGRNTHRFCTPEMRARTAEKTNVESALRSALGRNEFVLHYQPKMRSDGGRWTGVEALLRWKRPGCGLVLPAFFVPALEETRLILPVGAWVIDTACYQIREWKRAGFDPIPIAVNVSSVQIREEGFVSQVAAAISKCGINPKLLQFEITESTLMSPGEGTNTVLRDLKALGISIAIDDFGTGYSNLAYLKRFSVDFLKIDIAFIRDVMTNADDAAITTAIIDMAHGLRLKVVAEGVETEDQLRFLHARGCDEIQGYYLSRPLPGIQLASKIFSVANIKTAVVG